MCSSVLQCVAVCCSVLQCVAAICLSSVLRCGVGVAVQCGMLQCVAVCCSVLQCVAVCQIVWQCDAVCCNNLRVMQCVAATVYIASLASRAAL